LTEKAKLDVDPAILGLWEFVNKDVDKLERMLILKFSEKEYLVRYMENEIENYFRAYPIKVGGVNCIQLQFIGDTKGKFDAKEKDVYLVAKYSFIDGELEVKLLNEDLVSDTYKSSKALRKIFIKNKKNPQLFVNPGRFRRL